MLPYDSEDNNSWSFTYTFRFVFGVELRFIRISSLFGSSFYLFTFIDLKVKGKGKAIPLQAWRGPEGSRRLRLPDFKTVGT